MIIILIILCIYFSDKPQKAPAHGVNDPDKMERLFAEWKAQREADEEEAIRQAAILAEEKRQEQIEKLGKRLSLAEREINHYKPMLAALEQDIKTLDNKVWYFESKGLPCAGIKKSLAQKREQAYRMETKVIKAEFERDEIMDKLAS